MNRLIILTAMAVFLSNIFVPRAWAGTEDDTLFPDHFLTSQIFVEPESGGSLFYSLDRELETEQLDNYGRRVLYAHGVVGTGFLCYLVYGYYVFWQDVEYYSFKISGWDDTYQRSYAGGS
ncbi:hypothetical protein ACFL27_27165, partial [candidate division CSSED10-310 bacterium]